MRSDIARLRAEFAAARQAAHRTARAGARLVTATSTECIVQGTNVELSGDAAVSTREQAGPQRSPAADLVTGPNLSPDTDRAIPITHRPQIHADAVPNSGPSVESTPIAIGNAVHQSSRRSHQRVNVVRAASERSMSPTARVAQRTPVEVLRQRVARGRHPTTTASRDSTPTLAVSGPATSISGTSSDVIIGSPGLLVPMPMIGETVGGS